MTDDTRRHWHGTPGSRHEHHNVWTHGGSKGPAARAPWAQSPETAAAANARRDSDASNSSNSANNAASGGGSGSSTSPPTVSERRRSSNASGERKQLFANLHTQKRESRDPTMAGRRASWNEQREQGGFFAKWWDGYTRGDK